MGQKRMKKRYRRPMCLTGQKHCWLMGAALMDNGSGHLTSANGSQDHLKGACRKCGKRRMFHPHAAWATPTLGRYPRVSRRKLVAA